jgi:hypothetical protein
VLEDLGGVAQHDGGHHRQAVRAHGAMVATSPARPPAPLGSLALKLSTQAGGGLSCSAGVIDLGVGARGVGLMGVLAERGRRAAAKRGVCR